MKYVTGSAPSGLIYENVHAHSIYSNALISFPDSPTSIGDYANAYAERGMQCLCITEHSNRSDAWEQADEAAKHEGMKAIVGAEAYFVPNRKQIIVDGKEKYDPRNFHLILIAKNNQGFEELNYALSVAAEDGFYRHARLDFDLLSKLNYKNFLCTTACIAGVVGDPEGERYACTLAEIFKENFRLEVQYHVNDDQIKHNMKVMELYKKYGWSLIFATDSHYIRKEDKILRTELQLSKNIKMVDDGDWDLYLPTPQEAYDCMLRQNVLTKAQIEESFENTLELRTFEGFTYTTERKLPISKPRQNMTQEERNKLYVRMVKFGYVEKAGMPDEREKKELEDEIATIVDTNSADYFISLKDMLDRGVELGGVITTTARGSAGSFASNFGLGFTTLNRLRSPVTMYPERFISADKLKAGNPDIDVNLTHVEAFEQAGKEMFGDYGCLPLIAYGKTKTSSAFKMLAKARGLDFDTSNAVSKEIQSYELTKKHEMENNSDDPDFDVDEHVSIEDFVDSKYLGLIEDSKKYQNIIVSWSPHPCARITYHKDLRRDIGTVRLKDKICLYMDGVRADAIGYVKCDLLRVDVVKMIYDGFKAAGLPVMPVSELLQKIEGDKNIWDLYAKGYTQCLNQCERPASTQKCMTFKPQNISELSYFVAGIRPGFKSNIQTFINRQRFNYGIPALDNLLKLEGACGETGASSYLIYDENILRCLKFAGIPGPEAYATIKAIKKKKKDKVLKVKEKFKDGFVKYLMEKEHASEASANDTTERAWKVIEDSASYLFCGAHAFAMACDSAYGAYLKAYHPFEFYTTILKLYTEKGNKEKVALIIDEMYRYKNIRMVAGRFGDDNRDWLCNKEQSTISQSLSSIKFISKTAANELYHLGQKHYDTFTDVLRAIQLETHVDERQVKILITIGYFSAFGKTQKLLNILNEFNNGKNRVKKETKSYAQRLVALREFEQNEEDVDIPIRERLMCENENVGLCLSKDNENPIFFVSEVDDKYGVKVTAYNSETGRSGLIRVSKGLYSRKPIQKNDALEILRWERRPRYSYKDGKRIQIGEETDVWMEDYSLI